jgi:hypothetical protein
LSTRQLLAQLWVRSHALLETHNGFADHLRSRVRPQRPAIKCSMLRCAPCVHQLRMLKTRSQTELLPSGVLF